MKVLRLNNVSVKPAIAKVFVSKNNDLYYNIKHGTRGDGLWEYSCGLRKVTFTPETPDDEYILKGNNYVLNPVKIETNYLTDGKNNNVYNIATDESDVHKSDVILFWDIPNKNYINVTYTMDGLCVKIAEGITGRTRGSTLFSSPAPVIEILGDCTLKWTGNQEDGSELSQTIKYHYTEETWDISPILILKK